MIITIDQFRYIKIQPQTIDLTTRLWGINTEFVRFIPRSLVLRSIVFGWILIYRNWSIHHLSSLITTHDDFDSANPSSMQDACHIWTQLKWLCSQWVLVAQWIERSPVLREVMGSIPVVPGHARVMLINSPFILKNNFTNIYRPPTS